MEARSVPGAAVPDTGAIGADPDLLVAGPTLIMKQRADRVELSVVVPVKNGLPWLREQLQALTRQRCCHRWEIIVANNGSSDRTEELVKEFAADDPRITLVDASHVRGAAATRNIGVRHARGCLLAFCDADDVVHPGWVQSWVGALAEADVAGGLFDNRSLNDVAPPFPATLRPPPTRAQFGFLPATGGGNMAVRRHAFELVGGFDERFAVGEDVDLCWRLQLAGYRFTLGEGVISRREALGLCALFRRSIQFGRCGPALYERYRGAGLCAEPAAALRSWLYLIASTPKLFDSTFRRNWVRLVGWRVGRLLESCRRRVFFL
jgi:glycosyltransferase involved in cell wall biosynthesis